MFPVTRNSRLTNVSSSRRAVKGRRTRVAARIDEQQRAGGFHSLKWLAESCSSSGTLLGVTTAKVLRWGVGQFSSKVSMPAVSLPDSYAIPRGLPATFVATLKKNFAFSAKTLSGRYCPNRGIQCCSQSGVFRDM